ncbi:MAG: di-trans,poly-cis-decaprenylcistransferase [Clostridia bacterium]|nr:di-trans,poly-cis-decaprenylcistransferase [Clostridia bacterium]
MLSLTLKDINMKANNKLEHLAIIMDGNGRWATRRGKSRLFGHKAGVESLKRTVSACIELDIKILSVFAFSTENWSRPKEEVDGIMNLISDFCEQDVQRCVDLGVKVVTMGDLSRLPDKLKTALLNLIQKTKDNNKLIVNVGINYGARAEIVRAVNLMLADRVKSCDEKTFANYLYTSQLPDPDLIIRASGENRLSNFMLYQCAYSEFYFPKVHWPDFNKKVIQKAIKVYQKRNRRFGGLLAK